MQNDIELRLVIDGKEAKALLDTTNTSITNLLRSMQPAQNSLESLNEEVARLSTLLSKAELGSASFTQLNNELTVAKKRLDDAHAGMSNMKSGSGNATMAVMGLSQALGDAGGFAYSFRQGMMGVGNNLQMVVQSVMQLHQDAGSAKGAMSDLAKAFTGPMGLMMGINAAITFMPMLIDYLEKSGKKAVESAEGLKKYNEQLKDIGAKDIGTEITQREMIVKALEDALEANKEIEITEYSASTRIKDPALDAALNERLSINKQLLKVAKDEKLEKDALLKYQKELNQEMTIKLPKGEKVTTKEDDEKEKQAFQKRVKDNEEREQKLREQSAMSAEYRVAVMKEGFEKELAEIDLRYSKEIEKAKGNAELLKLIETARDNERNRVNDKALQAAYERQESEKKFSNFSRQLLKTDSQYQLDWLEKERQQVNANEEYKEGLRKRASEARRQRQIRELKESSAIADEGFSTLYNYTQANKREEVKAALESKLVKLDSDKEEALSKAKTQEEKDAINKSYAAKEKALRDQANDEVKSAGKELFALAKAASIAQATINTYEAATKAMDAAPPPMSFILAGITVAAGMAHVATIAAQQPQGLALGGLVRGAGTGTSDSIPAYLSNGEFVVNARSTALNYPALKAINSGVSYTAATSSGGVERKLDELIVRIGNMKMVNRIDRRAITSEIETQQRINRSMQI